jgi:hypothetical protein
MLHVALVTVDVAEKRRRVQPGNFFRVGSRAVKLGESISSPDCCRVPPDI